MSDDMPVVIAGTGSSIPPYVITNAQLAALIGDPAYGAEWAAEKVGILERCFSAPLDERGHPTLPVNELDLAEDAARKAVFDAGMELADVDGIYYVSCTQPHELRFSRSALDLHRRLGLRGEIFVKEVSAGCGGVTHAMAESWYLLRGNPKRNNVLIVAANAPSRYYGNWPEYVKNRAWHSMYIFGDGAGAVVLRKSQSSDTGIIAAFTGVDPKKELMYYHRKGDSAVPLYDIDSKGVFLGFAVFARKALDGLGAECDIVYDDIHRFHFHQVNPYVLTRFIEKEGLPIEKVPMHAQRYGNIAAAATLVLLDEDRKQGNLRRGDLLLNCTVGAGAQYGAMLIRL